MLFPTDAGDRLLANLRSGKPSLCAYVFSHPNLVEVAGLAGFDCFMADMMFTALDWEQIAQLIRGGPWYRHCPADPRPGVPLGRWHRSAHHLRCSPRSGPGSNRGDGLH